MGPKLLTTFLIAVLSLGVGVTRGDDKKPADAPHGPRFTGGILADARADLSARVAGAVDRVNVNEGDRVKKGQVLIELGAPELKDDLDAAVARIDRAKAEVEQAEAAAQAAKARVVQADAALEAARAAVKRDKAGADQAQAEADRLRKLGDTALVPAEELEAHIHQADAAKAAVEEAEAQVKTAEAARDVAVAEVARAEAGVHAAQADVEIAQAGVRRAQTQLGFTKIVAPFDGVVARLTVDVGATVAPQRQGESAPLVAVMRDDVVQVYFDVDELSVPTVKVGVPVVVCLANGSEFPGKVTRMAGDVVPNTGTLRAYVALPNPDDKLKPGMFAIVEVKTDGAGK